MLSLSVQPGDYITIGPDIVIQFHTQKGKLTRIAIEAPKDLTITRSKFLEESGQTPDCLKKFREPAEK